MGQTVGLHDQAISNLKFIRDTMERSAAFTAVPGWGGVLMGVSALVAAYVAATRTTAHEWMVTWVTEAGVGVSIGILMILIKARGGNHSLTSNAARKFALSFAPPIFAGMLLTPVLYDASLIRAIPGLWLLLYGVAVISGGAFSVGAVPIMGVCFVLWGGLALNYPLWWGNVFLAGGFGGLHIVFGIFIARKHGG